MGVWLEVGVFLHLPDHCHMSRVTVWCLIVVTTFKIAMAETQQLCNSSLKCLYLCADWQT